MQVFLKNLLIFFAICIIIFIQQYPNYYAHKNTPSESFFTGQASWFDPWDINVYVTAIRYGQEKNILLKNHYTTDSSSPTLIYPIYTIVGYLFRYDPFIIFHVQASISTVFAALIIFKLYSMKLKSLYMSISALIICFLGGGLGWIPYYTYTSAGSNITSFNFNSIVQRAHEGIGTTLYICALYTTYLYLNNTKSKKLNYITLTLLIISIVFYPYYLASYFVIVGSYIYFKNRCEVKYSDYIFLIVNCCIVGLFTLIYYFHLQATDFVSAASEVLPNVSLLPMFLGYGNFIGFFIFSFFMRKDSKYNKLQIFLILWIIISILMSYLPGVGFSRFYLRGLFFPLTLLMFIHIYNFKDKYLIPLLLPILIFIFTFSRLNIFYHRIEAAQTNHPWIYMPLDIKAGLQFLEERGRDGILTPNFNLSNLIPAYTGKSTYFGHLLQTPDAEKRVREINNFYMSNMSDDEALSFLKNNKITFVIYFKDEMIDQQEFYSFLTLRFENNSMQIYSLE